MMKMKACKADFGVAEVKPVQLKAVLNQQDTCGRKYRLLRQAKQEWDAKSEHEESIPTTEMKRGRLYPSRAQDYKKVDKDDSKILSIGKWAWVLQRANEIEQEKRRRVERK